MYRPVLTALPSVAEAHLHIQHMPRETLLRLQSDPSELARFIQTLPSVRSLEDRRQQMIDHNRSLARKNLQQEPVLVQSRAALSRCFDELRVAREKYLEVVSTNLSDVPSPDLVLAQLQSSVQAHERTTSDMIDVFVAAKHHADDLDRFIESFLRQRRETIELRLTAETFAKLYRIEQRK